MKFIREEPAGDGHTRYLFALGKAEARILEGLLVKALEVMPKLFETQPLEARMRNMRNEIYSTIPQMDGTDQDNLTN